MSRGVAAALRIAVSIPVGGAVGYAICHKPFLDLLFTVHGLLLAPLATVAAATRRWQVVLLFFAATSTFVAAEANFVFAGDLLGKLVCLNTLIFALALAAISAQQFLLRRANRKGGDPG